MNDGASFWKGGDGAKGTGAGAGGAGGGRPKRASSMILCGGNVPIGALGGNLNSSPPSCPPVRQVPSNSSSLTFV